MSVCETGRTSISHGSNDCTAKPSGCGWHGREYQFARIGEAFVKPDDNDIHSNPQPSTSHLCGEVLQRSGGIVVEADFRPADKSRARSIYLVTVLVHRKLARGIDKVVWVWPTSQRPACVTNGLHVQVLWMLARETYKSSR